MNKSSWKKLIKLAQQLQSLAPWAKLYDSQVFGIRDPETEEIGWISILGHTEELQGINIYPGGKGFESLYNTMNITEGFDMNEFIHIQNCISIGLDDPKLFDAHCNSLYNPLDTKPIDGKTPIVQSYTPGYFPWQPTDDEVQFASRILEHALKVLPDLMENPAVLDSRDSFVLYEKDEKSAWKETEFRITDIEIKFQTPNIAEEAIDLINQTCKVKADKMMEIDVFHTLNPIQDSPEERPYYPRILICSDITDEEEGTVLHSFLESADDPLELVNNFIAKILEIQEIPGKIHVCEPQLYYCLMHFCAHFEVELEIVDGFEDIQDFKPSFRQQEADQLRTLN
jgi:hypothetical protein